MTMRWHRCEVWFQRGFPCPYGGTPEQQGQEQEPRDTEEDARITEAATPAVQRASAQVRIPKAVPVTVQVRGKFRMPEALAAAARIPVPAELQPIARIIDATPTLSSATGAQEDTRSRQIPRPAQAGPGAESGPRGLELLAGLPGADPAIAPPPPGDVPFNVRHAVAAENIVAHFFQTVQVQSEETGARQRTPVNPVQQQSEEVPAQAVSSTAAEFADFARQAASLQILASLGVGMSGLERVNLLGTQTQVGGSQPVRSFYASEPVRSSGLSTPPPTRVGPNVVKPSLFSGSGDFKSFGEQFRSIGPIDRRFDVGVH